MRRPTIHHDLWDSNYTIWGTAKVFETFAIITIVHLACSLLICMVIDCFYARSYTMELQLIGTCMPFTAFITIHTIYGHDLVIHGSVFKGVDITTSDFEKSCAHMFSELTVGLIFYQLTVIYSCWDQIIKHPIFYSIWYITQYVIPSALCLIFLHDRYLYRTNIDAISKVSVYQLYTFHDYIKSHSEKLQISNSNAKSPNN